MQVGDIVRRKGDCAEVLGIITEIAPVRDFSKRTIYFVCWACDMCDDMWAESWHLELIS